jgi:hypothetical protein
MKFLMAISILGKACTIYVSEISVSHSLDTKVSKIVNKAVFNIAPYSDFKGKRYSIQTLQLKISIRFFSVHIHI